ncbi:MAG: class I SAM-dependent methyltransferase [Paracoccaceae bacterium]
MTLSLRRHRFFRDMLAPFSRARRGQRTARFVETMGIEGGERIIDLGGTAKFWGAVAPSCDITVINLPGTAVRAPLPPQHRFTFVEGDACALPDLADDSFDIAFSNSVIEHVGDAENRAAHARELRRLAPRYWLQTPSIWFPVEAHTGMPFYWFYPAPMKRYLKREWRSKLPNWTDMIEGTTVVSRREVETLLPEATIWTERFAGFPKSYVAYKT